MGKRTDKDTYCIYMHTFPNGKRYIGQTCVKPEIRWRGGRRYSGLMGRAVKKYGWENIKHEILCTDLSQDAANEAEIKLIAEYDTTNPNKGYNITVGGDGYRGTTHTEKSKEIIRQKAREQWRRQKAEGYTPPPITEEHRRHLSESHMGQRAWNKGKHTMDDETKARLREARKKFWDDVRNGLKDNPNKRTAKRGEYYTVGETQE